MAKNTPHNKVTTWIAAHLKHTTSLCENFRPQDNLTYNSRFLPVMVKFLPVTSLNIEQNFTKVACRCDG